MIETLRIARCCVFMLTSAAVLNCAPPQSGAFLRTQQTQVKVVANNTAAGIASLGSGRNFWLGGTPDSLINAVLINGRSTPVGWKLNLNASQADSQHAIFVYDCSSPKLQLSWQWRAPSARGPVEHTIAIKNLSASEIWLPLQNSLQYRFAVGGGVPLKTFYVEKGADKPSDAGTHQDDLKPGTHWTGYSSTYAHTEPGKPREIIPFLAIENGLNHSGWYVGVEFSGRVRLSIDRDAQSVSGALGLNGEPGPFETRLKPGETFETPTVFIGAYVGGYDELGNVLRPWVREVLGNASAWNNPNYPLLANNSWGSGMEINEVLAQRMIRDGQELGLEMFHMDAGWFRGVGDWYPDPAKFPHGLAAIADYAHSRGLKFGLWADWTQAGLDTQPGALNVRDPKVKNWTVSDLPANWKPEPFKGQTIDIGEADAAARAGNELLRMVNSYRLDMLEHDGYLVAQGCVRYNHPHAPPEPKHMLIVKQDGSYIVESSNSTDVSYHAVHAYYDIQAELRRQHPDLLLEICNDGGRMVDFGTAKHGDYFSTTDTYDPVSNRRAFYDASYLLPPAMLESYVEKWPAPRIENFRYMLRSGMMGWLTIMQDTGAWSAEERAVAKQEFDLYKKQLRPLIRDADLYHSGDRPDGVHWDGVEYFDVQHNRGVLFAFRGSERTESEHTFNVFGLTRRKRYSLTFHDGSSPATTRTGRELLLSGLTVKLPAPNSSELVFFEEVDTGYDEP